MEVYQQLCEVMIKRGGPYAGADIPEFYEMAEALFTPEEAMVNNAMPQGRFLADDLAKTMERNPEEITDILETMADKGLCFALTFEGIQIYQAAPFMPGILEMMFVPGTRTERDKKLAFLIANYKKAWEAAVGIPVYTYPRSRVITVDSTVQTGNAVHTYDQVYSFIEKSDPIAVGACYCRHAADLRSEDIHGLPTDVCMNFGHGAQFAIERLSAKKVTKDEAKAVLKRAEEAGLIHMSMNTTEDVGFICNCDRWHCVSVNHTLAQPKPGLMFNSGFEPRFESELCTACETCLERCPAGALLMGGEDIPEVNLDRCFGCAVCATGCPDEAIYMISKPDFETPPKDRQALYQAILASKA